jgi:hypothetical protein
MKLPSICAEFPPLEKPDITNMNPPRAANKTKSNPRPEVMRTALDLDHTKDNAKTAIARKNRKIPSAACQMSRPPMLCTSEINPAKEYGGGVTPLEGA